MLKTVIKRDGTREPADIGKPLGWSRWAARGLEKRINIHKIIRQVFENLGEEETTATINKQLRERLLQEGHWPALLAAGRIAAADLRKNVFGGEDLPAVSDHVQYLVAQKRMKEMNYSAIEWKQIDRIIKHDRDFELASFQILQISGKYALRNSLTKQVFETPQFTFMRMALALAEPHMWTDRIRLIQEYYDYYSQNLLNAPTPNYNNLGTLNNGLASCCLSVSDDTAPSLAAGSLILNSMTYSSAGTGHLTNTRSLGDPVREGVIKHRGLLPYFRSDAGVVKANTQGGRGGALTEYISIYNPEIETVLQLQNPRTPIDLQNRDIHFSIQMNRHFGEMLVEDGSIALFNTFTQPELSKAFYSHDQELFKTLYNQFVADTSIKKAYLKARELCIKHGEEWEAAGTLYLNFVDEMNRHTPFIEPIHTSNLCGEAMMHTAPYPNAGLLYKEEDHGQGEVALCSLGAINVALAHDLPDEVYEDLAYKAVLTADTCIDLSHYELPHIGYTAKHRRSVGIGITGLATVLARKNLKYSSREGLQLINEIFERHAYFVIKASLRLGRELGNAPWIHKTRWPEGWTPYQTYNRNVDELVTSKTLYDWEALSEEIKANGGIRNTVCINHMPGESSSKATGCPNGPYPIRDLIMLKSDADQVLEWAAIDSDLIGHQYENAYGVGNINMCYAYAVMQKWTDQGTSCDYYTDLSQETEIFDSDMVMLVLNMIKYGNKSAYYHNVRTTNGDTVQDDACAGACKM